MAEGNKATRDAGGFRFKVRGPREFYGGLVLIGIAILAIWASRDLAGSHGFAFGPGTAPRMFAVLLVLIGGAIAISGLLVDGPPIEKFAYKGPAFVVSAILLFACMIRGISLEYIGLPISIPSFGLVISTFVAFMVSIMASREKRWFEAVLAACGMTLFCVVLFVYALALPFQLWPSFF